MRNKYFRHCSAPLTFIMVSYVLLLTPSSPADAQDCVAKACISVFIQDGKIIIEGRKDPRAPVVQVKPRRTSHRTSSPVVSAKPRIAPRVARPVIKKATPRKKSSPKVVRKVVAKVSLNDRLIKLLPTANISQQPSEGAVVGVPVIFWCDLPSVFTSKVSIIGEVIDVTMRPVFIWSFGDGSLKMTTESGAPYPSKDISHKYSRAGQYPVVLVATWGGTWAHNGVARAITGTIRKTSFSIVNVAPAPTVVKR